jgi:hypothetical protein
MEFFKSFIGIMAYASLGFTVAAAYLKINKIWKRKHNAEVADSVSIVGNVIYLIPLSFFALNYIFIAHWQGLIDSVIWIASGIVYILIGSRLWVQSHRHKTFWTRLQEVLKLERSEVGDLAKSFFRPSGAEIILNILAHFAYIDRKLTVREKEFIQSFVDTWHMKFDWNEHSRLAVDDQPVIFIKTREKVEQYLDTSPPVKQVSQLIDVLHVLAKIDESVSAQEKLILEEVDGLLLSYLNASDAQARFGVVIAPQNDNQDSAIATLLPDVEKSEVAGGSGYMIGSYYSQDYAGMICNQYRALGFFTIEIIHDVPEIA